MQLREVKKYYDNGKLWKYHFIDEQERVQGKYICYLTNGITKDFEAIYKDNKLYGKCINYCMNGAIFSIKYYWHGEEVTKAEFLRKKYNEAMKCS